MKTIVLLGIMVMSTAAFAATDCRVVEFPDHYEAVCTGEAQRPPASISPESSPSSALLASSGIPQEALQAQPQEHQEQTFDALLAAQEQAQQANSDGDVPIVVSDLGRRHAEAWLKTQPHP